MTDHEAPAEVLADLIKEYRPSMNEDVLRSWAADVHRSLAAGRVQHVALLDEKGDEVLSHSIPKFSSELADGLYRLYTVPPADPAKASEPEYDRGLIADMLDDLTSLGSQYTYDAIRKQMDLLSAADNADAAKVRTVRASGSAPDGWREFLDWCAANVSVSRGRAVFNDQEAFRSRLHAMRTATPPASAPEPTEAVKQGEGREEVEAEAVKQSLTTEGEQ